MESDSTHAHTHGWTINTHFGDWDLQSLSNGIKLSHIWLPDTNMTGGNTQKVSTWVSQNSTNTCLPWLFVKSSHQHPICVGVGFKKKISRLFLFFLKLNIIFNNFIFLFITFPLFLGFFYLFMLVLGFIWGVVNLL
jgi:hypothetical protein